MQTHYIWRIVRTYRRVIILNSKKHPEYTQQEIQIVLGEYEKIRPSKSNLNDKTVELAYKLFVAAISGDGKARNYFADIPEKYSGLDGYYGEQYGDLKDKLSEWDKK